MKTCLSDIQAFVGMKIMMGSANKEKEVVTDMTSLVNKFQHNLKIQISAKNIDTYGTTTATSKGLSNQRYNKPNKQSRL